MDQICDRCGASRARLMTAADATGTRRVCGMCMFAIVAAAERRAIREGRADVVVFLDEAAQAAQDVPPQVPA